MASKNKKNRLGHLGVNREILCFRYQNRPLVLKEKSIWIRQVYPAMNTLSFSNIIFVIYENNFFLSFKKSQPPYLTQPKTMDPNNPTKNRLNI